MLHAVVVGVDVFTDLRINRLQFACADAEAFAHLLNERIDSEEREVTLLLNEEATKRNLMIAIGEDIPRKASEDDVVLLYFATHGSPETEAGPDQTSRYLIAQDTEYQAVYATGIDMERELPRWFGRIVRSKLILVFIDACFSGAAGGRTFEGPHLRDLRGQFRGAAPISLRKLELGAGRLIMTACDDDQVAREDADLKHGVFTYYLLQALKTPRETNSLTVTTLYDEVVSAVQHHTKGRQVPILNGRFREPRLPNFAEQRLREEQ